MDDRVLEGWVDILQLDYIRAAFLKYICIYTTVMRLHKRGASSNSDQFYSLPDIGNLNAEVTRATGIVSHKIFTLIARNH